MALVSIVTPVFNASKSLKKTVTSVREQTFSDWELLLVDDYSQDNSSEIARDFAKQDSRIKVFQQTENKGAAAARNLAIENASGRYIAFLDSDDSWLPEKLERQLDYMERNKVGFVCSGYSVVNVEGKKVAEFMPPKTANYYDLLRTCSVGCLTAMYDTHVFGKVFMPLIKRRQDYGLWLELLRNGGECHGLQEALAHYSVGGGSLSQNKFKAAKYQWTVYRDVEKLSLLPACYYFVTYCVNGLLKYRN